MNIVNCEKYNHFKPPYEYAPKFRCCCAGDANLKPCPAVQVPAECKQPCNHGLLQYRNWWERIEVDITVNGERITGIPIFTKDNTLRIINNEYSYFIPLDKVDYIRTTDGLRSCFSSD